MTQKYLGDGLYAEWDGFHLILRADDNVVYLEDTVIQALLDYLRKEGVIANDDNKWEDEPWPLTSFAAP